MFIYALPARRISLKIEFIENNNLNLSSNVNI